VEIVATGDAATDVLEDDAWVPDVHAARRSPAATRAAEEVMEGVRTSMGTPVSRRCGGQTGSTLLQRVPER
jgi:hypothetical protein